MAEYGVAFTLTTPASTVTFNAGSGQEYVLDPDACHGLDQAELRVPVFDKPQTDGGLVMPGFKKPRRVTLSGVLLNRTGTAAARNTMEDDLRGALDAIIAADGTLAWTPSGGSARSLTVRCEVPLVVSGGFLKTFIFGLVAANPNF